MEVPRVAVGPAGLPSAAGIARPQVLDLHHLGAEPGEGFRARRPGLKLGEVHDANIFETIEFYANAHRWSLPLQKNPDSHAYHPDGVDTTGVHASPVSSGGGSLS